MSTTHIFHIKSIWWFLLEIFQQQKKKVKKKKTNMKLTRDADDFLQVAIDRKFSLDLRPKIARDHICCHDLDFVDDSYVPNDLNCGVVL